MSTTTTPPKPKRSDLINAARAAGKQQASDVAKLVAHFKQTNPEIFSGK